MTRNCANSDANACRLERSLVGNFEHRTILGSRLSVVVDACSTYVRVAQPFLDHSDVCPLIERVRRGRGAGGVRPEPVNAQACLPPVELNDLVDAIRRQRRVGRPTAIALDRTVELPPSYRTGCGLITADELTG